jgi:hypothetical protein
LASSAAEEGSIPSFAAEEEGDRLGEENDTPVEGPIAVEPTAEISAAEEPVAEDSAVEVFAVKAIAEKPAAEGLGVEGLVAEETFVAFHGCDWHDPAGHDHDHPSHFLWESTQQTTHESETHHLHHQPQVCFHE